MTVVKTSFTNIQRLLWEHQRGVNRRKDAEECDQLLRYSYTGSPRSQYTSMYSNFGTHPKLKLKKESTFVATENMMTNKHDPPQVCGASKCDAPNQEALIPLNLMLEVNVITTTGQPSKMKFALFVCSIGS